MHGVLREEFLVLLGELCGERLVVGDDQGRHAVLLDDLGRGVSFSRAGDTVQGLMLETLFEALHQAVDRLRLIACGGEFGADFEGRHVWLGHALILAHLSGIVMDERRPQNHAHL